MARALSADARAALYAVRSDVVLITLMTIKLIDENNLVRLVRVCDQPAQVISRGEVYQPLPMRVVLPSDSDAGAPRMRLEIANVTREISDAVRAADRATADIELVFSSAMDDVEVPWRDIQLSDAGWDAAQVSVTLSYQDSGREPYPAPRFTPETAPGVF